MRHSFNCPITIPVSADGTEDEEIKLVPEVVAPVSLTFKFHNLCDFQYLPAVRKKVSRNGTTILCIIIEVYISAKRWIYLFFSNRKQKFFVLGRRKWSFYQVRIHSGVCSGTSKLAKINYYMNLEKNSEDYFKIFSLF